MLPISARMTRAPGALAPIDVASRKLLQVSVIIEISHSLLLQ
jgi:hypothetical protein